MNKRTILIHSICGVWPSLDIDLAIAESNLQKGNRVEFVYCSGELRTCHGNREKKKRVCAECQSRISAGLKWVGEERITATPYYSLTAEQRQLVSYYGSLRINTTEDLVGLTVEGVDVGLAALSTLMTRLRDANPDVIKHKQQITNLLLDSIEMYFSLKNRIESHRPDAISLYNGREANFRPVLRLGQQYSIETDVYEGPMYGYDNYTFSKNTYCHDPEYLANEYVLLYENAGESEREKEAVGASWFIERIEGRKQTSDPVFTSTQKKGLIPELDPSAFNVVIFNSSYEEFAGIPEYTSALFYKDHNEGIRKILSSFKSNKTVHFILRVHPNLAHITNLQTAQLDLIRREFSNLTFIEATSPVSTYDLMGACDAVITFGSQTGIEACFLGKTSILLGNASYRMLGGTVQPRDHNELVEVLSNLSEGRGGMDIPSRESQHAAAIIFGYGQKAVGRRLDHLRTELSANDATKYVLIRDGKDFVVKAHWLIYSLNRMADALERLAWLAYKSMRQPKKALRKVVQLLTERALYAGSSH